jgi:2-keto-3-deoxy-L-rhamnonate aldolase RhmA
MRDNHVERILSSGSAAIGSNLQIDHPWLVEMIGHAGYDWVVLDGEHGNAFGPNLPAMIIAAENVGITPIVRVPSHDRGYLLRALESGAGGVMVPMVETAAQARTLVGETKFAPLGNRGFSTSRDYGGVSYQDGGVATAGLRIPELPELPDEGDSDVLLRFPALTCMRIWYAIHTGYPVWTRLEPA